jgi:hypothetical protein
LDSLHDQEVVLGNPRLNWLVLGGLLGVIETVNELAVRAFPIVRFRDRYAGDLKRLAELHKARACALAAQEFRRC